MLSWTRIDWSMKMGAIPRGWDKKLNVNNNLKNKIASYKGNVWFKVYPDKAFYEEISYDEVEAIRYQNKNAGLEEQE